MAEFVLNNNYLKFNEQTFLQFSGPVVGAKFASSYVYIYTEYGSMDFNNPRISTFVVATTYG